MPKQVRQFLSIFEVKFKIALLVVLFFYLLILIKIALSSFRANDPVPDVKVISVQMRKNFRDLSTKVKVGLYIRNFPTFDFINNQFVADGMVWFELNKNEMMLKTIEKFSFENSKILYKSPPKITMEGDRMVIKYDVIFDVKTDLDFHRFPLEDHRISITLANNFVSPNEMYFDDNIDSVSFVIADDFFTPNWSVHGTRALSGYSSLDFDDHDPSRKLDTPKVVFTIDFAKNGINKILIIFVPIFAAIFLALATFLMSFNSYQGKYTLAIAAVTALLGYRFVIQQMSPTAGYFTITDTLFIFFLVLSFLIFIFQVLLVRHYMFLMDREKIKRTELLEPDTVIMTPRLTERINSFAYFIAVLIFAFGVTYIVLK